MKKPNEENGNKNDVKGHYFHFLNDKIIPFILTHFIHQVVRKQQDCP